MATVRRIYTRLDRELTPATEHAMERHLRSRPRHGQGTHRYSLEEYGLDRADLDQRFAPYRERFEVERQEPGN